MIHDMLPHAGLYAALHPRFAASFAFLAQFSANTPDGRIDLAGDDLYALVQGYDTAPAETKKYESHRAYIDIQFIATGHERLLQVPLERATAVTPYQVGQDYRLYAEAEPAVIMDTAPGSFAIFFPQDVHKPGCAIRQPERVKKVVLKARV